MKTVEYTKVAEVKAVVLANHKALTVKLEEVRLAKREAIKTGVNVDAARENFRVVKDEHLVVTAELHRLNEELKALTKAGKGDVPRTGKRGRKPGYTKVHDLKSLKNVLKTKGVSFEDKGIFINVHDKKVGFMMGNFYVDKVKVTPTEVLKSL